MLITWKDNSLPHEWQLPSVRECPHKQFISLCNERTLRLQSFCFTRASGYRSLGLLSWTYNTIQMRIDVCMTTMDTRLWPLGKSDEMVVYYTCASASVVLRSCTSIMSSIKYPSLSIGGVVYQSLDQVCFCHFRWILSLTGRFWWIWPFMNHEPLP